VCSKGAVADLNPAAALPRWRVRLMVASWGSRSRLHIEGLADDCWKSRKKFDWKGVRPFGLRGRGRNSDANRTSLAPDDLAAPMNDALRHDR
jgi:hypothetical protein